MACIYALLRALALANLAIFNRVEKVRSVAMSTTQSGMHEADGMNLFTA
jgi:hypothetical protein